MVEVHVISALRLKRAEISGHIHDLEKRIARQPANLANLDATIKFFSPGTNPDAIPPKRAYRRTRYFAHNELSRLTQDALRTASRPLTSAEIAAAVMQAKGMSPGDAAFMELVATRTLTVLRRLVKRGTVAKSGTSRNAQWALARHVPGKLFTGALKDIYFRLGCEFASIKINLASVRCDRSASNNRFAMKFATGHFQVRLLNSEINWVA
jgi:hypothetical protein